MNILNKKLLRDLWLYKGQFISVLVLVVIGVMFYTGINSGFRNMSAASENYYKEYNFADLWAALYKAPAGIEQKIEALPFVKKATGRVVQDVSIDISGENADLRMITLPDKKEDIVNDVVIKSGQYFSDAENNQCLVEEGFFKAHGLKEGDTISPVVNGNEVNLKVVGSVINPEYVYVVKDSSELIGDNKKFGIIYVKKSFGQAILGYNGSINDLAMMLEDGTDIKKAKDEIKKKLNEFGVKSITDRDTQLSSKMVSEKLKGYQSMGATFPIIFFIVAGVIVYITMGRMVENQRTQIGVLKAFGFSDLYVLMHYLSFSAFIAVVGSGIGSILGVFLGKGFTDLINVYFNFPNTEMKMYPDLVLPASLLTLFFCLFAGYNACKKIFKIMPSEAMRQKSPLPGKKIAIEKIGVIWKKLSHSWKMILRNIFRYKRRALLTSIGVIFATSITVFALGEKSSVDYLIDQQYTNIQNYDIKVNFSKLLSMDDLNDIKRVSHIAKLEPVLETGVEISNGWRKKDTGFTALVDSPEMYKVTDQTGHPVKLPQNGILIPEKLAKVLDVKPGDTVFIKSFLPGKEKKEVRIKGIIAQYLGTSAYGSLDSVNDLFSEGKIANSAVIRLDNRMNEKKVIDALTGMSAVSSVQSKSDAIDSLMRNMAAMTSVIGVMIVLAAVLSISVIYNIATINIFERQRELAILKVLGFLDRELSGLIFNENYVITVLGIFVGLPLGKWLGSSMMAAYETDAYTFPFVIGIDTYIVTAILTLGFTALANFTLMKKIRKIDMIEVLKSNE